MLCIDGLMLWSDGVMLCSDWMTPCRMMQWFIQLHACRPYSHQAHHITTDVFHHWWISSLMESTDGIQWFSNDIVNPCHDIVVLVVHSQWFNRWSTVVHSQAHSEAHSGSMHTVGLLSIYAIQWFIGSQCNGVNLISMLPNPSYFHSGSIILCVSNTTSMCSVIDTLSQNRVKAILMMLLNAVLMMLQ